MHGGDGRAVLERAAPGEVDLVRVFFPDPWPKPGQRHRRLVRPALAVSLARGLAVGGVVELCTDDPGYAVEMAAVLAAEPGLRGGPAPRAARPCTHYERLARDAGRTVIDLRFARVDAPGAS